MLLVSYRLIHFAMVATVIYVALRIVPRIVETFAHVLVQDSSVTNAAFFVTQCHMCH